METHAGTPANRSERRADAGVEGNARLTAVNAVLLRLLGPVVVILTLVLLASGVALLLVSPAQIPLLHKVHKASFILWLGAMTIHVLGHLADVSRSALRDWLRRGRREVAGAGTRQWLIAVSMVAGAVLGVVLTSRVGPWQAVH